MAGWTTTLGVPPPPADKVAPRDPMRLAAPVLGTLVLALAPNFLPAFAFALLMTVGIPVLLLGFARPTFRLVWLCGGGVALLNTTNSISVPKAGYLIGVVVACLFASYRLLADRKTAAPGTYLCVAGVLVWFGWVLCVTLPQAVGATTPLTAWSRDAFTELLMPAAVLIGLDVSRDMHRDVLKAIIVTIGLVGMVQFAVTWTSRRGLLADNNLLLFGSQGLLVLPLSMGLVYGLGRRGYDPRWLLLACGAFASVLVTGTRQGFLLLFAFVGVGFPRKPVRISPLKLVSGFAVVALMCLLALVVAAPYLGGWDFVVLRAATLTHLSSQGQFTDMSINIRLQNMDIASNIYNANPFFGVGLGVIQFGDTPMVQLAKLGLFGSAALLTSIALILGGARNLSRDDSKAERVILRACVVTWIAMGAASSFIEDKGFSLALGLLIALLGSRERESGSRATTDAPAATAAT